MIVGDLVRYKMSGPKGQVGVVIEDCTMMCSHAVDEPYRMGPLMIMWNGKVVREIFDDLEVINESR